MWDALLLACEGSNTTLKRVVSEPWCLAALTLTPNVHVWYSKCNAVVNVLHAFIRQRHKLTAPPPAATLSYQTTTALQRHEVHLACKNLVAVALTQQAIHHTHEQYGVEQQEEHSHDKQEAPQ